MKKNILQNLSLAFCICLFSTQISAQVIPDPGNDPLSDSLYQANSISNSNKAIVPESPVVNKEGDHENFLPVETAFFIARYVDVEKIKKSYSLQ